MENWNCQCGMVNRLEDPFCPKCTKASDNKYTNTSLKTAKKQVSHKPTPTQIIGSISLLTIFCLVIMICYLVSTPKANNESQKLSESTSNEPKLNQSKPDLDSFEQKQQNRITKEKNLINECLSDMSKGRDTKHFFCNSDLAVELFTVVQWEIVDQNELGIKYTVRIQSSTKGGIPVTGLWHIDVLDKGACIGIISKAQ